MDGNEIRKRREQLNLTQTELANTIGVTLRTIQNYEKGGVIPSSKYEILQKTLNNVDTNFAEDNLPIKKEFKSNELMTGNELKEAIRKLGITQEEAANKLNITRRTLQNWFLLDNLDSNISQNVKENLAIEKYCPETQKGAIRYWVDVDATGGNKFLFDDTVTNKFININIPEFRDCTDAVNLYGDSMEPKYKSGQIIILKEWNESFIEYGNVFLLITLNGHRMVKYLRRSEKPGEVLCVSANPQYDPFAVKLEDIFKLFIVKGAIEKTVL